MGKTSKQKSRRSGWASAISSGIVTFIMLILLALAVALIVIPKVMGGMSLTVLTGSMEPGIKPGDIVVTKGIDTAQARDLAIGTVVAFLPYPDDPTLVTHRIIEKTVSADGVAFTMKGDNNNTPDSWNPVHDYQVRGEVIYTVPKIGYARQWASGSVGWVVPAAAVLLIGYGVFTFAGSFRKSKSDEADGEGAADPSAEADPRGWTATTDDDDDSPPSVPRRALIE